MLASGFLKAEPCSAPESQQTQVTIAPKRERRGTLVSYNFLLLIFLIVIHRVLPGLGRSASILKDTQRWTLSTAPTHFQPLQGINPLALQPSPRSERRWAQELGQQRGSETTPAPFLPSPPSHMQQLHQVPGCREPRTSCTAPASAQLEVFVLPSLCPATKFEDKTEQTSRDIFRASLTGED